MKIDKCANCRQSHAMQDGQSIPRLDMWRSTPLTPLISPAHTPAPCAKPSHSLSLGHTINGTLRIIQSQCDKRVNTIPMRRAVSKYITTGMSESLTKRTKRKVMESSIRSQPASSYTAGQPDLKPDLAARIAAAEADGG